MKKSYFTLFIATTLFLGVSLCTLQAQQLVDYQYKIYKLGFKAPVGFVIDNNTAEEFAISDDNLGLTFYIRPYKDSSVETALAVAQTAYDELGDVVTGLHVEDEGEAKMQSGLQGYYFVASGKQDGKDIICIAMGAIDPNSDVNFYGVALYYADANAEKNTNLVIKLIQSFKKI